MHKLSISLAACDVYREFALCVWYPELIKFSAIQEFKAVKIVVKCQPVADIPASDEVSGDFDRTFRFDDIAARLAVLVEQLENLLAQIRGIEFEVQLLEVMVVVVGVRNFRRQKMVVSSFEPLGFRFDIEVLLFNVA